MDATARSSPHRAPGAVAVGFGIPTTGFPSGTASPESPGSSRTATKEDTASQGLLQARRYHLPDQGCVCTEDDVGPSACISTLLVVPKGPQPLRGCSVVGPWQNLHQFLPFLGGQKVWHSAGYNPWLRPWRSFGHQPALFQNQALSCVKSTTRFPSTASPSPASGPKLPAPSISTCPSTLAQSLELQKY